MTQLRPKNSLGLWFASRDNEAGITERPDGVSVQSSITDSYCPKPRPRPPPPRPKGLFRHSGRPEDMVIAVTMKRPTQNEGEPFDAPTDSTTGSSEYHAPQRPTIGDDNHGGHAMLELESVGVSTAEFVATDDFIAKMEMEAEHGVPGCENDAGGGGEVVFRGWEPPVDEPKKSWWGVTKKEEPKPAPVIDFVPPQSIEDAIKELQMLNGIRVKCLDESSLHTMQIEQGKRQHEGEIPPCESPIGRQSHDEVAEPRTHVIGHGLMNSNIDSEMDTTNGQGKTDLQSQEKQQDQIVHCETMKQQVLETKRKHIVQQGSKGTSWWSNGPKEKEDFSDDDTVMKMEELLSESDVAEKVPNLQLFPTTRKMDPDDSQEIKNGWFFSGAASSSQPRGQRTTLNLSSMKKAIDLLDENNNVDEVRTGRRTGNPNIIERNLHEIEGGSSKASEDVMESFSRPLHDSPLQHYTDPPSEESASDTTPSGSRVASFLETSERSNSDTVDRYMSDNPPNVRFSSIPLTRRTTGATPRKKVVFQTNNRRSSISGTSSATSQPPGTTHTAAPESPETSKKSFLGWGFMKNLTKEKVSLTLRPKRISNSSSFGGLLRPPPNRDFTMTLRADALLENKEERDIRFKWNQQLVTCIFAPYRKMLAEDDDLIPSEDEYYAVKEAREANEEIYSGIRDKMLQNGEITEREIAAFFDAFAICTVKAQALQSQILGLKATRRAEEEERLLRNSVARNAAMNKLMRDPRTSEEIKLVLRDLEIAETKQRSLEAQLRDFGIVLEEIKTDEEERIFLEWDHKNEQENIDALQRLRRHIPVNIKSATEAQLCGETTPNGKVLPRRFAKKFKTTNVLQLIRLGPDDIAKLHPATLENLCIDGLTLTEARALHAHLMPVGDRWMKERVDELGERRYRWFTMMKQNFKDDLAFYEQHVEQYGPPGNHTYATRACPGAGCPLIGNQCPVKQDKMLDYSFDYGYPDGPEYDEPGSIKTENEFARAKAQEAAEALITEKALDRKESFEAHYARFENSATAILLANASCEAMDYAMDRMDFLQVRWIKMRLLSERQGASSDEQARNEIMGFTEALQNVSLAVAQAAERSGMTLTGAKVANNKKADFRGDVETGLAEELCETADGFLKGIAERLCTSKVKDSILSASINYLRLLLSDLHQRNLDNLIKLGARRPPRSRKVRTREEIETRINTKLNASVKKQEELGVIAPPQVTETRPLRVIGNRSAVATGLSIIEQETIASRWNVGTVTRSPHMSPRAINANGSRELSKPSYTMHSPVSTALKTSPTPCVVSSVSEGTTSRLEVPIQSTVTTLTLPHSTSKAKASSVEQSATTAQMIVSSRNSTGVSLASAGDSVSSPSATTEIGATPPIFMSTSEQSAGISTSTSHPNSMSTSLTPNQTVPEVQTSRPWASSLQTRKTPPIASQPQGISMTSSTPPTVASVLPRGATRAVSSPVPTVTKKRESIEEIKARIAARRNTRGLSKVADAE